MYSYQLIGILSKITTTVFGFLVFSNDSKNSVHRWRNRQSQLVKIHEISSNNISDYLSKSFKDSVQNS